MSGFNRRVGKSLDRASDSKQPEGLPSEATALGLVKRNDPLDRLPAENANSNYAAAYCRW